MFGSSVPDYRGMFLRGHGGQIHRKNNGSIIGFTDTEHSSGDLGVIQGDAVRNIYGRAYYSWNMEALPDGAIEPNYKFQGIAGYEDLHLNYKPWYAAYDDIRFDASRVVPTANENRPVNKAVKYIIKVR